MTDTEYNLLLLSYYLFLVVICFHFAIFVVLETTVNNSSESNNSCDLLSFYYLCRTGNNMWKQWRRASRVVICFHFTIFVVLETTIQLELNDLMRLWFAFILLSLSYWKQLPYVYAPIVERCDLLSFYYLCRTGNNEVVLNYPRATCCDLLSFYYLCRTGNNYGHRSREIRKVVICFHFTIFVVLETTQ